jgi:hypothetical protein
MAQRSRLSTRGFWLLLPDLCNDAHMKQMDQMIAEMTDAAKQKEATAALDQSKAAMKKGDTTACMKHMAEAHKAMACRARRSYFVSESGAACETIGQSRVFSSASTSSSSVLVLM